MKNFTFLSLMIAFTFFLVSLVSAQTLKKVNLPKKQVNTCLFKKKGEIKPAPIQTTKNITANLSESFNIFPPAGWSVNPATGYWIGSASTSNIDPSAYGDGLFAFADIPNYDAGNVGSMITPVLHPVAGNITLSYEIMEIYYGEPSWIAGGMALYIEFSTDGTNWTTSTTNVLTGITGHNTAGVVETPTTFTVDLSAYNGGSVQVRFRAVSDWGGFALFIDNVTGPEADVVLATNDIIINKVYADFYGMSHYSITPISQLGEVYFTSSISNVGTDAQTNVTLTANVNNNAYTSSTGDNNPTASFASSITDTLTADISMVSTVPTDYGVRLTVTQTQTDETPLNNTDSVYFSTDTTLYLRGGEITSYLTSYSFTGSGVAGATGYEFGADYHFLNNDVVNGITVFLYGKSGSPTITGRLYSMDLNTGVRTEVASTSNYAPTTTYGNIEAITIPLTAPYNVTGTAILTATIEMNITAGVDTVWLLADGQYPGDFGFSEVYIQVSGVWDWYNLTSSMPLVGVEVQNPNVTVDPPTATTPVTYCQGVTATALTATGSNLLWYTVPTGGTGSATAPIPTTTTPGTTSYYVSQTVNSTESDRTQIDVIINATPSAPTVTSPVAYCVNSTANALTATGSNLLWYTTSTGGTGSATAPTPVTSAIGATSYFVSQTINTCESARGEIVVNIVAPPTASISATSTNICAGNSTVLNVNFTGTSPWTFNLVSSTGTTVYMNITDNPFTINVTPTGNETYTVNTLSDGACSSSETSSVSINYFALPTAAMNETESICEGTSASTDISLTGTGPWDVVYSDGTSPYTISGITQSPYTLTLTPAATTSYTLTSVTANTCTGTASGTYTVTINTYPVVSLVSETAPTVCGATDGAISVTDNVAWTYTWSNFQTTSSITNLSAGTYVVSVTNNDCETTFSHTLSDPGATVNIASSAAANIICAGESVIFTATGTSSGTYEFFINSVSQGSINHPLNTFTTSQLANGDVVYVEAVEGACTSVSSNITTTVNPTPAPIITYGTSASFCAGGSINLSTNETGTSFQWYVDASPITGATTNLYDANTAGSYTVEVTNAGNCTGTSSPVVVTVNLLPVASITAAANTFCEGDSVLLSTNAGAGLNYQWYSGTTAINSATANEYYVTVAGDYSVEITDANLCENTSTTETLSMNAQSVINITAIGSTTICGSETVLLVATENSNYSYQWYNGLIPIGAATNDSLVVNTSGDYTVEITDGNSCANLSNSITVSASGTAVATITPAGSTTFCDGESVQLDANTGAGFSYQWYLDGNAINGATTGSLTAETQGDYTVEVTENGCTAVSTVQTITINALPNVTVTADGNLSFCQGGSVILTATNDVSFTYQWYEGTTLITVETNNTYSANASGSYSVEVTGANTCVATTIPVVVTVTAIPTATATPVGSTSICAGESVQINATTGANLTYQWYLDNTPINGETSVSINASIEGNYTVEVSENNCSATSTAVTVTVSNLPVVTISAGGTTTFCEGGSVTLSATSDPSYSYQWYNGTTAISGAISETYSVDESGDFTVEVMNANNCSNSSSAITITVNDIPVLTIADPAPVCATTVDITSQAVILVNTGDMTFFYSDTVGTVVSNPAAIAVSGTYYILSINSCGTAEAEVEVVINTIPVINLGADTTICPSGSLVLDAGNAGASYLWTGGSTSQTLAVNGSALDVGIYSYSVTVTNGTCQGTDAIVITVDPCLDITETNKISIDIYPNPNQGMISIAGAKGQTIELLDIIGKVVMVEKINNSMHQMNLTQLSDGTYFVRIKESKQVVKQIILQK
ncbi:MAG TPA: hypothetical protein DEH02_19775 [Bacteroidales bacterium]|nr:MAG: hypothetical protein A2491_20705 [Bacteroidetes bacterium RIFOXYC12_FULL_35_7]HBX53305.1 hypothetical protein [Bacteroidales bacterium]